MNDLLSADLKQRLSQRAYHRALYELRDVHRGEFEAILERCRAELGVYRDGCDVDQATSAEWEFLTTGRKAHRPRDEVTNVG